MENPSVKKNHELLISKILLTEVLPKLEKPALSKIELFEEQSFVNFVYRVVTD